MLEDEGRILDIPVFHLWGETLKKKFRFFITPLLTASPL